MPIPQVADLFGSQAIEAVVSLPHLALLVFPLAVGDASNGQHHDGDLPSKVDGVSDGIFWPVRFPVCPRSVLAYAMFTEWAMLTMLPILLQPYPK